ncbi:MFS transporter [Nocardia rhamnosiphila]
MVEHPSSGESQHAAEKALNPPSAAPSGLAGYRAVLGAPGVALFLGVSFLARIPSTATGIALSLHVVLTLGLGYFEVGLVTALYTVGRTIGSPLLGLLLDRRGLRTMLVVATSVESLFWTATPWLSYPMLMVGALVSGLFGLPVSALIRQTLTVAVPRQYHRAAFAIDSISIDLSYIFGPALGALLVLQLASPIALQSIGLGWAAAGIALWVLDRPTRAAGTAAIPPVTDGRTVQWFTPRLGAVFLAAAIVAVLVCSTQLTIIAGLQTSGQTNYLALAYTAWCVASVTGSFCYGAVPRHPGLFILVACLGLATLPLGLAGPWWSYMLLLLPAGLMCAPPVAAGSEALGTLSPEQSRGVVNGIYDSSMAIGAGITGPVTGWLIDQTSPAVAITAVSTCAVVLAGVAGLLSRRQG